MEAKSCEAMREMPALRRPSLKLVVQMVSEPVSEVKSVE